MIRCKFNSGSGQGGIVAIAPGNQFSIVLHPVRKVTEYDQSTTKAQFLGSHSKAAACTQFLIEVSFSDQDLVQGVWRGVDTAHGFFLFDHETACRGCTVPQHVCAVEVTVLQTIRVSYVQKKSG